MFRRTFRNHLNIYEEAFCENSDDLHHKRYIKQIRAITTQITPKNGYYLLKHTRQLAVRTIGKCTTQYIIKTQDTKAAREHLRIQESLRILGSLSIQINLVYIFLSQSSCHFSPLDSYIISDRFRCFPDGKPIPST